MRKSQQGDGIRQRFASWVSPLDERQLRRWAASEAKVVGYGWVWHFGGVPQRIVLSPNTAATARMSDIEINPIRFIPFDSGEHFCQSPH